MAVSFNDGGTWNTLRQPRTSDLSQVTDKFYFILLYRVHLTMSEIQTQNFSGDSYCFFVMSGWTNRQYENSPSPLEYQQLSPLEYQQSKAIKIGIGLFYPYLI